VTRQKWPWDRYLWIYKCTARPYVHKCFGVRSVFMYASIFVCFVSCFPKPVCAAGNACPAPDMHMKHGRFLFCITHTHTSQLADTLLQVIFVLTSLCIIWGEATIPVSSPDLSPFSHMIRDLDRPDQFSIQLVTLLPLVSHRTVSVLHPDRHSFAPGKSRIESSSPSRSSPSCPW